MSRCDDIKFGDHVQVSWPDGKEYMEGFVVYIDHELGNVVIQCLAYQRPLWGMDYWKIEKIPTTYIPDPGSGLNREVGPDALVIGPEGAKQSYASCCRTSEEVGSKPTKSPIFCAHANEMPVSCPCDDDCYCKEHSCKQSKPRICMRFRARLSQRIVTWCMMVYRRGWRQLGVYDG